jgi:hypothetical protein
MKNNKTRKLIGGREARKYKTRSIPLQFVKEGNQQQPTNSISFNTNSIDKSNLGEQVLVIIKQLQQELVGNSGNAETQDNITFSIVGKKQIRQ